MTSATTVSKRRQPGHRRHRHDDQRHQAGGQRRHRQQRLHELQVGEARETTCPVRSASWRGPSSRCTEANSWRRRSCWTESASRPPRYRRRNAVPNTSEATTTMPATSSGRRAVDRPPRRPRPPGQQRDQRPPGTARAPKTSSAPTATRGAAGRHRRGGGSSLGVGGGHASTLSAGSDGPRGGGIRRRAADQRGHRQRPLGPAAQLGEPARPVTSRCTSSSGRTTSRRNWLVIPSLLPHSRTNTGARPAGSRALAAVEPVGQLHQEEVACDG